MTKHTKKTVKPKTRKIHALCIVGDVSKQVYLNENLSKYQVFYDGFLADDEILKYRGRGQRAHIISCVITYKI